MIWRVSSKLPNSTKEVTVSDQDNSLEFNTVLASSVHDMKNSLSMLLGTLDDITMQCGGSQCPSSPKFAQLQYEGQRVNNHLIQLLAIYKIENAMYSPHINEHSLQDFLEESAMQSEALLAPKGIAIDFDCDADLIAFFDREMVAGVVNNVVNNAYRYSKDKIRLSARQQNDFVEIAIEDNGNGYPQNMLCEHSDQLTGVNFKSGSTGLGLYFSSLVAKMHKNKGRQGYIACSNAGIDGGGKFSIFLP
jgi:K+-sensing histidine kinase KdpD